MGRGGLLSLAGLLVNDADAAAVARGRPMAAMARDRYRPGMKPPSSSGRRSGGSSFGPGGKGSRGPASGHGASGAPRSGGTRGGEPTEPGRGAAKRGPGGPARGSAASGHGGGGKFQGASGKMRGENVPGRGSGAARHGAVAQERRHEAPALTDSAPRPGRLSAPGHTAPKPQGERHAPRPPAQGARPQAPSGTIWLYGIHPVAAALANPARRLRRLLVTEEAEAGLAEMLKGGFSVQPERTERARLDHLLGHDAVHQGVALLADPLPQPALAAVLERNGPLLVLDQITDPRNVGAILRSAAAFGVAGVIAQDRHAPEETGALAKAASGALEMVPLIRAVNLARTLVALKAAGLWVVGLAADGEAFRGEALRERRVALVLGAEGAGLRRLTRETCDELAGLAMPGGMESLNVSNAAAVALYELTRG